MAEIPFKDIRVRTGDVSKQSRYLKAWRKRQLFLSSTLFWTYNESKDEQTEEINLFEHPVAECAQKELNDECAFKVALPERSFLFIAESKPEKDAWIHAINLAGMFCWKSKKAEASHQEKNGGFFPVSPEDTPSMIEEKYWKKLLELNGEEKTLFTAECFIKLSKAILKNNPTPEGQEKGLRCLLNSLSITKFFCGDKHKKMLEINKILGSQYVLMKQYAKAIDHYEAALEISQSIYGEDNLRTMECYSNLGEQCFAFEWYEKAQDCLQSAITISKKIGVGSSESTYRTLKTLLQGKGLYKA